MSAAPARLHVRARATFPGLRPVVDVRVITTRIPSRTRAVRNRSETVEREVGLALARRDPGRAAAVHHLARGRSGPDRLGRRIRAAAVTGVEADGRRRCRRQRHGEEGGEHAGYSRCPGALAEWLGTGLQNLVHRFDSGRRLLARTGGTRSP